jgi:hypothetical protein
VQQPDFIGESILFPLFRAHEVKRSGSIEKKNPAGAGSV